MPSQKLSNPRALRDRTNQGGAVAASISNTGATKKPSKQLSNPRALRDRTNQGGSVAASISNIGATKKPSKQLSNPRALKDLTNQGRVVPASISNTDATKKPSKQLSNPRALRDRTNQGRVVPASISDTGATKQQLSNPRALRDLTDQGGVVPASISNTGATKKPFKQLSNPRALRDLTNQGAVVPVSISNAIKPPARPAYARQVTDDLLEEEEQQQQRYRQQPKFELPSDSEGEEDDQDNAASPGYGYGYGYMTHNTPTAMEGYESSDDDAEQEPAAAVDPNSYRANMAAMRDAGPTCLDPHRHYIDSASVDGPRPAASEEKDWMTTQKELDELFTKQLKERMDDVPKIDMPEILTNNGVKLYKYQKQGVQWLVHKETTHEALPPFYMERPMGSNQERTWYENTLTKRMQRERPEPIRGSILADGKCNDDMMCILLWLYVDGLYSNSLAHAYFLS
jgi:hypothetical protein